MCITWDDDIFIRPFFRYWMSYDGNFRNPRKAKKVLNDDVCLTDGDMYYVEQTAYKNWVNSKTGQEPSTVSSLCLSVQDPLEQTE